MAFGFPASFKRIVQSDISKEEFHQKSLLAFNKLNWKLLFESPGYIKVDTKANFKTLGETFFVNYKDMKNIRLKSRSRFFNIFDWGMNKSNVRVFWSYFSNQF